MFIMDPVTSFIANMEFWPFTQLSLIFHNYAYSLFAMLSLMTVPYSRKPNVYFALAGSMVVVILASLLLKDIYSLPRPCNDWLDGAKTCMPKEDYGFPSGHTAFAFVFVGASLGTVLFPVYLIVGTVVGFSRIYLGVHSLTDVGGGVILGIMTYFIVEELVDFLAKRRSQ